MCKQSNEGASDNTSDGQPQEMRQQLTQLSNYKINTFNKETVAHLSMTGVVGHIRNKTADKRESRTSPRTFTSVERAPTISMKSKTATVDGREVDLVRMKIGQQRMPCSNGMSCR